MGLEEVASDVVVALLDRGPGQPGEAALWVGDAVADAWPGGVTLHCRDEVVRALVEVVGDDARVAPTVRAAAGNALARLGDPRPGVGLRADGLPDIAWCKVPGGAFEMGSRDEDEQAWEDEKPLHPVDLQAFQIARYPVTNAQYQAFVDDRGYSDPRWQGCWTDDARRRKGDRTGPERLGGVFDLDNHPVVGVTWYEAAAFCHWLTLRLRESSDLGPEQVVRLPSEAEWEKAARGVGGRVYPWGEGADPNRANYRDTGIKTTSAVGCFPGGHSPYGCEEISGNVWEWTRSLWGKRAMEPEHRYPYEPDDGRENLFAGADITRVLRGGAFHDVPRLVRCAYRRGDYPGLWGRAYSFRVVLASPG
jgi:formylglycine-generating enzyme required for sulfatase activity